ncbi:hypothetical protein V8F33_008082 [Rhypophila sp. PSN 637]
MQFTLATILALATTTLATPIPEELQERGTVTVTMFGGDVCNGQADSFQVTDGGRRCVPVRSAKRSISVSGGGCSVTTFSGTDCRGSSFHANIGSCTGALYGSVRVDC